MGIAGEFPFFPDTARRAPFSSYPQPSTPTSEWATPFPYPSRVFGRRAGYIRKKGNLGVNAPSQVRTLALRDTSGTHLRPLDWPPIYSEALSSFPPLSLPPSLPFPFPFPLPPSLTSPHHLALSKGAIWWLPRLFRGQVFQFSCPDFSWVTSEVRDRKDDSSKASDTMWQIQS